MRQLLLAAAVAACGLPQYASGQSYVEIDTLRIVGVDTFQIQSQPVALYFLETTLDDQTMLFGEMFGYIAMFGVATPVDTILFQDPIPWFKIAAPAVDDWWPSLLPLDPDVETWDIITGFGSMNVGGSTVPVVSMDVYLWDDDSYIGEKWYGEDVGLIGWDVTICNEHYTYTLQSWTLTGGSGYWPRAVGNEWVYEITYYNATVDAPVQTMTVDGNGTDWQSLPPILSDGAGDDTLGYTGTDIRSVYAAADQSQLYLMLTFWDGSPDTLYGSQSTAAYRFEIEDWSGYVTGMGVYYDPFYSEWTLYGAGINPTGGTVAVGDVIEISIPLANLGWPSELPFIWAQLGNGSLDLDYTCYTTVNLPASCPITTPGDVTGEGNLSTGDIVYLVNLVFKLGPEPVPCMAAADMDCNGNITSADIIYLVNKILKAGPDPCDVCALIPSTWTCP